MKYSAHLDPYTIACELYNQDPFNHVKVTPETFYALSPSIQGWYIERAQKVAKERADRLAEIHCQSISTAEEDRKFIEEHPINGDIDLAPWPLLRVE
jgi:hypothetical protein